jgi:hypothetical protein
MGPTAGTATLFVDNIFGENTGYTFDITSFLQQQIRLNAVQQDGLLIYAPSASAFNRIITGDRDAGKSRIQVKIYYVVVK